jgi:hypothetical protein
VRVDRARPRVALRFGAFVFGLATFAPVGIGFASEALAPPCAEQRVLVNLARSAIGDAFFEAQRQFDAREASWNDWVLFGKESKPRSVEPVATREAMTGSPVDWAPYQLDDVQVVRVRPIPDGAAFGLMDFRSTVRFRVGPSAAALTLVERHTLTLSDGGSFRGGGRTVDVSPTPVMSALEAGAPCRSAGPEEEALATVHADVLQAVQRPDREPKPAIDIEKGQTQLIVGQLLPDGSVTGRLVAYRQAPATGPERRLERSLIGAPVPLPGSYSAAGLMFLDGAAGAPFARIVLRPTPPLGAKAAPQATFTALVRIAGPEMFGGQIYDWSFMNPLREIPLRKPQ